MKISKILACSNCEINVICVYLCMYVYESPVKCIFVCVCVYESPVKCIFVCVYVYMSHLLNADNEFMSTIKILN